MSDTPPLDIKAEAFKLAYSDYLATRRKMDERFRRALGHSPKARVTRFNPTGTHEGLYAKPELSIFLTAFMKTHSDSGLAILDEYARIMFLQTDLLDAACCDPYQKYSEEQAYERFQIMPKENHREVMVNSFWEFQRDAAWTLYYISDPDEEARYPHEVPGNWRAAATAIRAQVEIWKATGKICGGVEVTSAQQQKAREALSESLNSLGINRWEADADMIEVLKSYLEVSRNALDPTDKSLA